MNLFLKKSVLLVSVIHYKFKKNYFNLIGCIKSVLNNWTFEQVYKYIWGECENDRSKIPSQKYSLSEKVQHLILKNKITRRKSVLKTK